MRLSKYKKDKISEQILFFLYQSFPKQPFTAEIAREIARDEEFIKKILMELKERGLIISIRKNKKGESFTRRIKWRLSNKIYELYDFKQQTKN
jgi:predicted transcriptional regulator with HTH domain